MSEQPSKLTGSAAQVAELLTWAMERGLDVQSISVDGCRIELRPPPPAVGHGRPVVDERRGLYERFGGEVYSDLAAELGVPGSALLPAIEMKR